MPNHPHGLIGSGENGDQGSLTSEVVPGRSRDGQLYQTTTSSAIVQMNASALQANGGSQAHNNMQPYLGLNFIIALVGLYPRAASDPVTGNR